MLLREIVSEVRGPRLEGVVGEQIFKGVEAGGLLEEEGHSYFKICLPDPRTISGFSQNKYRITNLKDAVKSCL